MKTMRITTLIFLVSFSSLAVGQKIEYRNDSLFVNNSYVDAQTKKETLDSLLTCTSKKKSTRSDLWKDSLTGKKAIETTLYYYDLGLFFRKYDYDTTRLSVGIKLYCDIDKNVDKQFDLTKTFKGQLFIANNLINDKRQVEQLQKLNNCTVTLNHVTIKDCSFVIGGDIIYQKNIIRLSFDSKTNELTNVFIHHNLKR